MGKQVKQQKMEKNGGGMAIEQTIASDDSLLPSAAELSAYQQVDPTITSWLLNQTKLEQEHRHKTDNDKIKLMNKAVNTDRWFLVFFFVVVLLFIGLSAFFVYIEKKYRRVHFWCVRYYWSICTIQAILQKQTITFPRCDIFAAETITAGYFVSTGHPTPRSEIVCCL